MPRKFVYRGVTGPTSYKDGQFASDMIEARADQARVKRVLRNEKPLKTLKSMNQLNKHDKDMQKLKTNKYGT